jgi:hypothetical protein
MPKRDAGNLNETNVRTTGSMVAPEAEAGFPPIASTGQPMLPDLKLYDFAPDGSVWDGKDGKKVPGSPVELTERGGSKDGGLEEAGAALAQFGAGIKVAHDLTQKLLAWCLVAVGVLGLCLSTPSSTRATMSSTNVVGRITCATTPGTAIVTVNLSRRGLYVNVIGAAAAANDAYLGTGNPTTLTTANGFQMTAGGSQSGIFIPDYTGPMSCTSTTGVAVVTYMEVTS